MASFPTRNPLKLTKAWLLLLLLPPAAFGAPITPQFTTGTLTSRTESTTQINEQIVSHSFRTGYTYSAMGKNVRPTEGSAISPEATTTGAQTVAGVSFGWTSPKLDTKPQWEIVNPGGDWSLTESFLAPGLDNVTNITRTITTTSVTESTSVFK